MTRWTGWMVFLCLPVFGQAQSAEPDTSSKLGKVQNLTEIRIAGRKKLIETATDRIILNVQASPSAAGSSALGLLQRSPNIEMNRQSGIISMNGKSGVLVMINGKLQRMEPGALMQYLDGLPASQIRRIEFIHTPPASMEAAGDAGLINIELIRKEDEGLHGNLNVHAGYGQGEKAGYALSLYFNKGKWNGFADMSYSWNNTREDLSNNLVDISDGQKTYQDLYSKRPPTIGLHNIRAGVDYNLSKKTTLGFLLGGYSSRWKMKASTRTESNSENGEIWLSFLQSNETNHWQHYMLNLNLQHRFTDRSRLSVNVDYLDYQDENPTDYADQMFKNGSEEPENHVFRSRKNTPITFRVAGADYEWQWKDNWKWEVGAKVTRSEFVNDVMVSDMVDDQWVEDPRFSSTLILDEKIEAGYLSFEYLPGQSTRLRAGLRYEHTRSLLEDENKQKLVDMQYGRFFPSVSFSHQWEKKQQVQFSYNERITRPSFNNLAPAFFFFGPNNILAGNPAVRPTISRQLTGSYQRRNWLFTLQWSSTKNPISYLPRIDEVEDLVVLRAENVRSQRVGMLSVNYSLRKGIWTGQWTLSGYLQSLTPADSDPLPVQRNSYVSFSTTQGFTLPAGFQAELSGRFNSRKQYGLAIIPVEWAINAAVSKTLGSRHKLSLNWEDIFDTGSFWNLRFNHPTLNLVNRIDYEYEGSVCKLTYSYSFGNRKVKRSGSRKTAAEEEAKRVN